MRAEVPRGESPPVPKTKVASPSAVAEHADRATFHAMVEGTRADWMRIAEHAIPFNRALPDRLLAHLSLLGHDSGGFAITRLEHCLQTATRAHLDDRDEEYVVCSLLHDIGDTLGPLNHSEIAGSIVKPFVSPQNHFMVEQHAVFQGYYFFEHLGLDKNLRERFRGHEWFDTVAEFCALYDQNSFDPAFESMGLDEFEPMLRRVFAHPRRSIYIATDSPR